MSITDFIHIYGLKNKAESITKLQQILSSLYLNDVGIHLRDGSFKIDVGIVNFLPTKGTHWVAYINENYFYSYGCSPPNKLSKFIINLNGN